MKTHKRCRGPCGLLLAMDKFDSAGKTKLGTPQKRHDCKICRSLKNAEYYATHRKVEDEPDPPVEVENK